MTSYSGDQHVNVGYGDDIAIADLAQLVADAVGYKGGIAWDRSKPDGTPRKLMDAGKLAGLGWTPKIDLRRGVEDVYQWFLANQA